VSVTDDQVEEIAQRAVNGWLSRKPLGPAHDFPVGRMSQGRAARQIQERSMREARADIAALIQDRRELRSAVKAALSECGWTEQAVEDWLAHLKQEIA
jgi:hypothetical protein